jgi:L-fucose isomerase-like protein
MEPKSTTLGVILGNRDFFPDSLIAAGREQLLAVLAELGIEPVLLDPSVTVAGSVETWEDAKKCAALFDEHRHRIDGILISLPNFGDEKAAVEAIKLSRLDVPILVHAFPDDLNALAPEVRRDAFCGKISVCNNLYQYGIPYSTTRRHTLRPGSAAFKAELAQFARVCAVVNGLRRARIGAVGARPNAFNTTRYSEKLLQDTGIAVQTVDLSEILGLADKLAEDDARVAGRVEAIRAYLNTGQTPSPALTRMARFGVVLDDWMQDLDIDATAIQCWNSLQANLGANVCTLMSMMSERLLPSACEVDVTGAVSMYALQLASGIPSALVDWNNDYGDDEDKCVLFHCGNWARSFYVAGPAGAEPVMEFAPILGSTLGYDNTWGVMAGRVPAGPLSYARVSSDDRAGTLKAYIGEGRFVDDPLDTFGSRAVIEIPGLQELLRHVCTNGFEHHVAMSRSLVAGVLEEAFGNYLGWPVYRHDG